jgi:hypothetical protein
MHSANFALPIERILIFCFQPVGLARPFPRMGLTQYFFNYSNAQIVSNRTELLKVESSRREKCQLLFSTVVISNRWLLPKGPILKV